MMTLAEAIREALTVLEANGANFGAHAQRALREVLPQAAALSPLACWWAMVEAQAELSEDGPIPPDSVVLHFMGSGASTQLTAQQMRAALLPDNARDDAASAEAIAKDVARYRWLKNVGAPRGVLVWHEFGVENQDVDGMEAYIDTQLESYNARDDAASAA